MDDGFYFAATAMDLNIRRQETSAENLAAGTQPGFKRQFIVSSSFKNAMAGASGNGVDALLGSDAGQVRYDFTPGILKRTERRLDFAFDSYVKDSSDETLRGGQLFFKVQSADGQILLTRNGRFQINADRQLVTGDGMKLMNESEQPITFNSDDMMSNLCVSSDGQVKIEDRSTSPSTVNSYGFLQLALVRDPQRLTRLSGNYFIDADGSAGSMDAPAGTFNMRNGCYEDSNSSPLKEMNSMIQSVREYEMQAKIVKATTEIYKQETSKLSS